MDHSLPVPELGDLTSLIVTKIPLLLLWHVYLYFSVLFHGLIFFFSFRDITGLSEETRQEFETTFRCV